MTSIFICNDLINKLHILKYEPLSIKPCYIKGQLYYYNRLEIAAIDERILRRSCNRVFGYILTFDKKHIDYVLSIADSYNACSFYKIGIDSVVDMTIRRVINAHTIEYSSFEQLCSHKYETKEVVMTYAWLFNHSNKRINTASTRSHKVSGHTSQHILRKLKENYE